MQFLSKISKSYEPDKIISELSVNSGEAFDLGILFITAKSHDEIKAIIQSVRLKTEIKNFLACTCAGIIGSDEEIEEFAGASLLLAKLPGVTISPFTIEQSQLDQLLIKEDWFKYLGVRPKDEPVFLVLPDPFQLDLNAFLAGINAAYADCSVIGGLASGASASNGNVLAMNDAFYTQGLIGVILTGNVKVDTVVSQGCRPIGESFIVTKSEQNIIYELGGRTFLDTVKAIFENAPDRDKKLAQESLFVGIVMNEYKDEHRRGDFLVRGVLGIDPQSGAGIIADYIENGQTVQFHLRDAQTATEDLNELLNIYRVRSESRKPHGALVFSCNGRGQNLFKEQNHDIKIIQERIGPTAAAGFFCAGEIGPVGGKNFLHGFTDSIALFSPKEGK